MKRRTLRRTAVRKTADLKIAVRRTRRTMKTKTKKRVPAPTKRALDLLDFSSKTDLLGSFTGNPKQGEKPVQDADDL